MDKRALAELTDIELLNLSREIQSAAVINTLLTGFLAGIVLYTALNNGLGLLTPLPLFIFIKW